MALAGEHAPDRRHRPVAAGTTNEAASERVASRGYAVFVNR